MATVHTYDHAYPCDSMREAIERAERLMRHGKRDVWIESADASGWGVRLWRGRS